MGWVKRRLLCFLLFLISGMMVADDVKDKDKNANTLIKEIVEITTDDEWILKGDFYKVKYDEEGKLEGKTILLLHMLRSDRNAYNQIIGGLTELGFNILNVDWRGHGESVFKVQKCPKGGHPTTAACLPMKPHSYKEFLEEDYKDAIKDVEATIKFLEDKGAKKENIGIIGASIGANFAVRYASANPQLLFLVLLSPGLKYMDGIEILELFKDLANTNIKIFLYSSSTEDDDYSYQSCKKLEKEYRKEKKSKKENLVTVYKEWIGHGTNSLRFISQSLFDNLKQFTDQTKEKNK